MRAPGVNRRHVGTAAVAVYAAVAARLFGILTKVGQIVGREIVTGIAFRICAANLEIVPRTVWLATVHTRGIGIQ